MKYWAYRHINGHIQLKTFRGDMDTVNDAFDSPFVFDVLEPFEAENRDVAVEHARERLEKVPEEELNKETK